MASTINAKTTGVGGIDASGDASGVLALQTGGTTALTIDASQNVTLAKGLTVGATAAPAFSAYASTNQALSATVYTKVLFDTELFDTNSNFASSRFTPTIAGYYQASTNIYASGTMANNQISFYKNGTVYSTPVYISANYIMQGATDLIYCNGSTDYVEVYFYNQFVGTVGGASGAQFVRFSAAMIRSA